MSEFYIDKSYEYNKRFNVERFLDFNHGYFDVLQSPLLNRIKSLKLKGTFRINSNPYRPDVLSYNIYQDTQYWVYLLVYNGIDNVMSLKQGLDVSFFDLDDLEELLYTFTNKNKRLIK